MTSKIVGEREEEVEEEEERGGEGERSVWQTLKPEPPLIRGRYERSLETAFMVFLDAVLSQTLCRRERVENIVDNRAKAE